jgi:hypothetical protein
MLALRRQRNEFNLNKVPPFFHIGLESIILCQEQKIDTGGPNEKQISQNYTQTE